MAGLSKLRTPVPVWLVMLAILVTASVATAIVVVPSYIHVRPDFSLQSVQASRPVFAGPLNSADSQFAQFKIRVASVNGFTGIVSFSAVAPAGISVALSGVGSPLPVALLGTNDTLQASVAASNVGNFTVTITGTHEALSHSLTLTVMVQDITFAPNPNPIVISRTSITNTTITLTGVNGFTGNLDIAAGIVYTYSQVNPSTVLLALHGTVNVTLTMSTDKRAPNYGMCPPLGLLILISAHSIDEGYATHYLNWVCTA